jgi:hypothetical protein
MSTFFHFKALLNLPEFLVRKYVYHLATLIPRAQKGICRCFRVPNTLKKIALSSHGHSFCK